MAEVTKESRPDQTLADYVAIALCPALIISLVGSLVFFLCNVTYTGAYVERMYWILFFFVFGIVLNGRIGMIEGISSRSSLYGAFLAGATWLCLQGLVEYPQDTLLRTLSPVINLGLIAIVWWSSSQLVWDCTNIDESTDMSGEGVLQAAGLDETASESTESTEDDQKSTATGMVAWWERYQRYRARQSKKRVLGVWVVYYSLAALPLFGLGQSLIPPDNVASRRFAFWMLMIYVGSGLALLMTTCFLGLRRYLRQRRVTMPASMTGAWMVSGAVLIVILLVVSAVLPRPAAENPLVNLQALAGGERTASNYAVKGDSPAKGDGKSANSSDQSDPNAKTAGAKGQKSNEKDGGKGEKGGNGKEKGEGEGKNSGNDKGKSGGNKGNQKDNTKGDGNDRKTQEANRGGSQEQRQQPKGGNKANEPDKRDQPNEAQKERLSSFREATGGIARLLKWIAFALVAIVVGAAVIYGIVKFLANFTDWAAAWLKAWNRWWALFFGQRARGPGDSADDAEEQPEARPPVPFSAFHNPFRLGQRWTPYELSCYTFDALEAWARERGHDRQPGETPLEFADRLGDELPRLEDHARRLALIYARGLYGPSELPDAIKEVLRQVWDQLEIESGDLVRV